MGSPYLTKGYFLPHLLNEEDDGEFGVCGCARPIDISPVLVITSMPKHASPTITTPPHHIQRRIKPHPTPPNVIPTIQSPPPRQNMRKGGEPTVAMNEDKKTLTPSSGDRIPSPIAPSVVLLRRRRRRFASPLGKWALYGFGSMKRRQLYGPQVGLRLRIINGLGFR